MKYIPLVVGQTSQEMGRTLYVYSERAGVAYRRNDEDRQE
jgi:hypothetical protein